MATHESPTFIKDEVSLLPLSDVHCLLLLCSTFQFIFCKRILLVLCFVLLTMIPILFHDCQKVITAWKMQTVHKKYPMYITVLMHTTHLAPNPPRDMSLIINSSKKNIYTVSLCLFYKIQVTFEFTLSH